MPKANDNPLGPYLDALQSAWDYVSLRVDGGLPDAVIILGQFAHKAGHFTLDKPWTVNADGRHEVMLERGLLKATAEANLATLLHEAAHGLNRQRDLIDCASNQRHNKKFKAAAEELGLVVEVLPEDHPQHWRGYAFTSTNEDTLKRWAVPLRKIEKGLGSVTSLPTKTRKSEKNYIAMQCNCDKPLRVAPKNIEWVRKNIRCRQCGYAFHTRPTKRRR